MTSCPPQFEAHDYKSEVKPVWCPGCGHFGVLAAITRAFAALQLPHADTAIISGIGCSSRLPAYTNVYGFHSIHGRALPIAQGLKVARPDVHVVAVGGDGDGFSIGGNHFMHACRRNLNMTYIVMDNAVYGMTKGQASPTTAADWCESKLTPEGPGVPPLNPLEIALASGASHVARAFSGRMPMLTKYIAEAIEHPGFSFIQVLSPCVTYCPEQRGFKALVHDAFEETSSDRRDARRRLLDDDGFGLGVLFKSDQPSFTPCKQRDDSIEDLEGQFAL